MLRQLANDGRGGAQSRHELQLSFLLFLLWTIFDSGQVVLRTCSILLFPARFSTRQEPHLLLFMQYRRKKDEPHVNHHMIPIVSQVGEAVQTPGS
jgi:hypothetical protein